jgi:hypothetical protein
MSIWFKCDARFYKDPKIIALPDDTTRYAFLVIIGEGKYVRSGGMFESRQHLEACLPTQYHSAIDALIACGLLAKRGKRIAIKAWRDWQVDPTSTERSKRARARVQQRDDNGTATVTQRLREEKIEEKRREEKNLIYRPARKSDGKVERVGDIILRRGSNA